MNFSENLENIRNLAVEAAQTVAQKTKVLAAIAKANVSIYAEEDKIRKAELQLGKLYYRDFALSEEMDDAEYLPWCDKITEAKKRIEEMKDTIDALKADMAGDADVEAAAEETADVAGDVPEVEAPKEESNEPKFTVEIEVRDDEEPKAE